MDVTVTESQGQDGSDEASPFCGHRRGLRENIRFNFTPTQYKPEVRMWLIKRIMT